MYCSSPRHYQQLKWPPVFKNTNLFADGHSNIYICSMRQVHHSYEVSVIHNRICRVGIQTNRHRTSRKKNEKTFEAIFIHQGLVNGTNVSLF